jgi:hypothetical protein
VDACSICLRRANFPLTRLLCPSPRGIKGLWKEKKRVDNHLKRKQGIKLSKIIRVLKEREKNMLIMFKESSRKGLGSKVL